MSRSRRATLAAAAASVLLGAGALGSSGCLSWLDGDADAASESFAASDRDALFEAAIAAFSGEESGFRVGDLDPVEGTFRLHRVEEWSTGLEAVDVDVHVAEDAPAGGAAPTFRAVAVATRRSLPRGDAMTGYDPDADHSSADVARRYRDADVEHDVLDRIRESAERFRVPRAAGTAGTAGAIEE